MSLRRAAALLGSVKIQVLFKNQPYERRWNAEKNPGRG
jgi:hypothetical protein